MKKLVLTICMLMFIVYPSAILAASRTVTLTWTMSSTENVQGYKVYYADNSAMNNKIWHNDCSNIIEDPSNTFTITCNNVDLSDNQAYYFAIAAQLTDNTESSSDYEKIVYIKPVQNLEIISSKFDDSTTGIIFLEATLTAYQQNSIVFLETTKQKPC